MRDVLFIPFDNNEVIVIASDNSGAIGMKDGDEVQVPYLTVGYYSFRVAAMECIAAGGELFAVTLQNFCGNGAWHELKRGIKEGLSELGLDNVQITGSTESNFQLSQSAIGLTVLGRKKRHEQLGRLRYSEKTQIAVIGSPLAGNEVMERESDVAPLSVFKQIASIDGVVTLPVGSKGIHHELNQLFVNHSFDFEEIETDLDIKKTAGPATCFLAAYPYEKHSLITNIVGSLFHEVKERSDTLA